MNAYRFACGDILRFDTGARRVTLAQEHGVYHVVAFDAIEHGECWSGTADTPDCPWRRWDSLRSLAKARVVYARRVGEAKGGG